MRIEQVRRWPGRMLAWPLWSLPAPLVTSILVVQATAVLGLGVALAAGPAGPPPAVAAAIVVAAAVQVEVGRAVERLRRRLVVAELYVSVSSVWFMAAAFALRPGWAGLCALVVHSHMHLRTEGPRSALHRRLYTTAVFVLATVIASLAMEAVRELPAAGPPATGVLVPVAGILVFFTLNTALVGGAIAISDSRAGLAKIVGDGDENLLEGATLALGALVGVAVSIDVWLVVAALPPLLVLQRAVLVRYLEQAASTDGKTGLLTAAAWRARAERSLARRRVPTSGLLVLDLDHFKDVNDTHGHLVGDEVLAEVAAALRAEVRDDDLVGRFGGEEFVVLVSNGGGPPERAVPAVADRIRRRVAALAVEVDTPDGPLTVAGLTISIGVALCGGHDLQTLMQTADAALYAAKRAGRNRVRLGPGAVVSPVPALPRPFPTPGVPLG